MSTQKKVLILALILIFLGLTAYFGRKYLWSRSTNTGQSTTEKTPLGEDLDFELKVQEGFRIAKFADLQGGLPRDLEFDPNGVLIASITNQGKVVALPDEDKNGVADRTANVGTSLNRPHGIAFDKNKIYIAEEDKVNRFTYDPKTFSVKDREELFSLPSGAGHFTRSIKIYKNKLYTSVGSSCNVCVEKEANRASILVSDLDGKNLKVYASGLRNTVFFDFDKSGKIWGADMGRDNLGDKLPPDELNIIEDGKNYGWPYCYGNKVEDSKFKPDSPDYCKNTQASIYDLPAHVAPLGISLVEDGLLLSLHGSWNSSVPVGYKVVMLNFPSGGVTVMSDFITGFLANGDTVGRPVDLIFDKSGNLYISDDYAGLIYIVSQK